MGGTEEWTEAEVGIRGAGRTLLLEVAVWVDTAGPEGGKKVERGEKMEGWRQQRGQLEHQVFPSEGLCGQCPWKQRWPPSYFHRSSVRLLSVTLPLSQLHRKLRLLSAPLFSSSC